ncbi:hypothetical protein HanLR1_Chr04g0126261 [Helianthus annuus]|nr:hypothetical protein HanHA89_Chr04g0134501 [Helianthus annuus]KAJ0756359.1 hypothetical protein HanLR1_Chr04g0126261 [Helianthus annuus]
MTCKVSSFNFNVCGHRLSLCNIWIRIDAIKPCILQRYLKNEGKNNLHSCLVKITFIPFLFKIEGFELNSNIFELHIILQNATPVLNILSRA